MLCFSVVQSTFSLTNVEILAVPTTSLIIRDPGHLSTKEPVCFIVNLNKVELRGLPPSSKEELKRESDEQMRKQQNMVYLVQGRGEGGGGLLPIHSHFFR